MKLDGYTPFTIAIVSIDGVIYEDLEFRIQVSDYNRYVLMTFLIMISSLGYTNTTQVSISFLVPTSYYLFR